MYSIVIKNGFIVDGTRNKGTYKNIGIQDEVIKIITEDEIKGVVEIDAKGKIVSPGFIDMHSHSDSIGFIDNRMESKLLQGVTTEVIGNCGQSLIPVKKEFERIHEKYIRSSLAKSVPNNFDFKSIYDTGTYAKALQKNKISVNIAGVIGHGTLRTCVMGFSNRNTNEKELEKMKQILEKELQAGAFGMSLGLLYPPGSFADRKELIELCKVLKKYNGILTVHLRNEGEFLFDSITELIEITKETGVKSHISHLKLMGIKQHKKAKKLLNMIKEANKKNCLNMTCDQYPYTASSTNLSAVLPKNFLNGGVDNLIKELKINKNILKELKSGIDLRGGPTKVKVIKTNEKFELYDGKTLDEISKITGKPYEIIAKECLLATNGGVSCIFYSINKEDMLNIMKEKNIAIASDGYAFPYNQQRFFGKPHPRSFGTFPKFLNIVRENNLMSVEDAVYKITGLPAKILGINNRGNIGINKYADITIFDFKTINGNSTFDNPYKKPNGIEYVINNGEIVFQCDTQTCKRPGKALLKENRRGF